MREIRFRVWSKHYEEMFLPEDTANLGKEWWYLMLTGELRGHFNACGDCNCTDQFVLEQYTGLKDRDGKDMYEGDIVQEILVDVSGDGLPEPDIEGSIGTIEWGGCIPGQAAFSFVSKTKDGIGYRPFTYCYYSGRRPTYRVIGNIHQNPNLLSQSV